MKRLRRSMGCLLMILLIVSASVTSHSFEIEVLKKGEATKFDGTLYDLEAQRWLEGEATKGEEMQLLIPEDMGPEETSAPYWIAGGCGFVLGVLLTVAVTNGIRR